MTKKILTRTEILDKLREIFPNIRYHELLMEAQILTDGEWVRWDDNNYLMFDFGSKEVIGDCVRFLAKENPYNPIEEYLFGLQAIPFKGSLSDTIFGIQDELNEILLRRFLIACVARALTPGCKQDNVLVLLGAQGIGKSSFFRLLGGEWFTDSLSSGRNLERDDLLILHSNWIAEWSELGRVLNIDRNEQIKSFLSRTEDIFRPPYGRSVCRMRRRFVITASTNLSSCLPDRTGNRRYWVIETDKINLDFVKSNRDALWSLGFQDFKSGIPWWLTPLEDEMLRERHKAYIVNSELDQHLDELLKERVEITTKELLSLLGMSGKSSERLISESMRALGWKQSFSKYNGTTKRVWRINH